MIVLPWWVLISLAAVVYVVLRYFIPLLSIQNSFLDSLARTLPSLALPLSLLFLCGALISGLNAWLKHRYRRRLLNGSRGVASIRSLDWLNFEHLVGEAYRRQGYSVAENDSGGADGGVDLELWKGGQTVLVQCKRWRSNSVGVSTIREHLGVMASRGISQGIVVCSGKFTQSATTFAHDNGIDLVDGESLATLVASVNRNNQRQGENCSDTLSFCACPRCGSDMVKKTAKKGKYKGSEFLGCSRYPACKGIMSL